mgnify:FL=1|jgi:tape measure domain-containing protein
MSSIDKRIVQMEFNNQGFESGVRTTLNSLKNLNEKLKMNEGSKGLDNISRAASKVNLNGLGQSVETVKAKFSSLGVVGATVLANITNSAMNAGKNLVSALTVQPIADGFNEYETKMNSIQTILTNTAHQGTTLKDVTKTLNELNDYADKTIYNFAEMTKNIGTFTAAGVDLDTSTAAIKGIANLAAASGSSSAQASTAMYQLSQALATGKVGLQDWNSVVNAGMGGKLFQDALIRTSEVMGTGADAAIKKYGSFRDSLTEGKWLTGDVLTETLKQISGAYTEAELKAQGYTDAQAKAITQLAENATKAATEVKTVTQLFDTMKESVGSGWAQSWEYIIGDKDQAAKLLTSISDGFNNIIQPSTDARNAMLKFWNENGGRDDVIKGVTNIVQGVGKGLGAIKDGFRDVFPPMTGEKLVQISEGFKNLTEKFKMSDSTAGKIKNTFKGVFSVLNLGKNAVTTLFKAFSPLTNVFSSVGKVLLTITSGIGKFASSINDAANKSNFFGKVSDGISAGLNAIGSVISGAGKGITSFFDYLSKLDFSKVFGAIGSALQGIGNGISPILEGIGKALGSIDFGAIFGMLNTLLAGGIFKTIKGSLDTLKSTVKESTSFFGAIKEAGNAVADVLNTVGDALTAWSQNIRAGTLLKIAAAVGILALSLATLSTIDEAGLNTALTGITALFIELIAAMVYLEKVDMTKGFLKMGGLATAMIGLATAILLLSASMKILSGLNWEEIAKGLVSIAGLMLTMSAAVKLMDGSSKGLIKTATSMIIFGAAIAVFASSVKSLGNMDTNKLVQGLVGIGAVLTEMVAFSKLMDGVKMGLGNAAGILVLAAALNVLASAVSQFGNMDLSALVQGLAGIGVILTGLSVFSRFGTTSGGIITTAIGLTALAVALNLMVPAVKGMGSISWENLAKGLLGMAGSLVVLGTATALISGGKLSLVAVGVGLMSASLLVLSAALQSFSSMSWESLAVGLTALAGSLTILGVAMYAMSGCILGATAMVIMAGALALLTPQLMALSSLSLQQVGTGLLALAGAFTVIGVAGLVLTPVVPTLIALAGAISLLSLSCALIGAGLLAFGTGLTLVGAAAAGSGFAILEFIRQLLNLLPTLGTKLAEAITNLITGFANGLPQILTAVTQLVTGLLQALSNCIPQIITTATQLVVALATAIGQAAPKLIEVGVNLILNLMQGIADNIEKIVTVGAEIVVNFINGIAEHIGEIINAGINLAIKFIDGVAKGLNENSDRLGQAVSNLIQAVVRAAVSLAGSAVGGLAQAGGKLIGGLIKGIKGKVGEAGSAVKEALNRCKSALSGAGSALVGAGRSLINGLVSGIRGMFGAAGNAVRGVLNTCKSALGSAGSALVSAGRNLISGFVRGIRGMISAVGGAIRSVISAAKSAASGAASALVSAGRNLINGLASGIRSGISAAKNAISSGISSVVSKAKAILKIHSPSRVFMEIGRYTVLGLAKGLTKYASVANKPAEGLAQTVINSTNKALDAASKVLNSDMDVNPVITPVMDLSKVHNGANAINNLLSNRTMSIAGVSDGISKSIGSVQNGVSNEEIVSAIKDLKNGLGNTSNTTYQINGITYDDGSNITNAVETLVRAAKMERRI